MRVEKFDAQDLAALRAAGFKVADDNESAETHCRVSILKPAGSGRLLLEIRFANGAWKLIHISRDDLMQQYEDEEKDEDDDEEETA